MMSRWKQVPFCQVFAWLSVIFHVDALKADTPRLLFGKPSMVAGISTAGVGEFAPTLTPDELEIFFSRTMVNSSDDQPNQSATVDIFTARRASKDSPFNLPVRVEAISSDATTEAQASISSDGLSIYYIHRVDSPTALRTEIWTASRPTRNEPFGAPKFLFGPEDADDGYYAPHISADGLSFYVQCAQYNGRDYQDSDICLTTRASSADPWGPIVPVPELTTDVYHGRPSISPDNRMLFYKDFDNRANRDSSLSTADLYMLYRSTSDSPWSAPINLGDAINLSETDEAFPELSADGKTLYFSRIDTEFTDTTRDIYQAPLLDFLTRKLDGQGGSYSQSFNTLGTESHDGGTALPRGWTFTGNDIIFADTTTSRYLSPQRSSFAAAYNAGPVDERERALATNSTSTEHGELNLRIDVTDTSVQAMRLLFDIEAWQVFATSDGQPREGEFQVVLEADSGQGFAPLHDFGLISTGPKLFPPATGSRVNGNDPAYRVSFDSGPIDVDIPQDAHVRLRWISTDKFVGGGVLGIDDVALRFATLGDANIDGSFDSSDLIQVFQRGEFEDNIVGNSTWWEGDWNNDQEFDSGDLVASFQQGGYAVQATAGAVTVPEPTSWLSVALALALIGAKSRGRVPIVQCHC